MAHTRIITVTESGLVDGVIGPVYGWTLTETSGEGACSMSLHDGPDDEAPRIERAENLTQGRSCGTSYDRPRSLLAGKLHVELTGEAELILQAGVAR